MNRCLTSEELARCGRATPESPEEWAAMNAHLAQCAACRENLQAVLSASAESLARKIAPAAGETACLEDALMQRYVFGEADAADTALVEAHVADCRLCAQDLASLRAFRDEMRDYDWTPARAAIAPPSWWRRVREWFAITPMRRYAPAFGGAAALAALAGLLVFRTLVAPLRKEVWMGRLQQERMVVRLDRLQQENAALRQQADAGARLQNEMARLRQDYRMAQAETARARAEIARLHKTPRRERTATPEIALALNDAGGQIGLDSQGRVWRGTRLAPDLQREVETTLKRRSVGKPGVVASLVGETSRLMGESAEGVPFALVSPVGTVVLSNRPTFRWKPLAGAAHYRVTVFDQDFNAVAQSASLSGTRWTPPKPLARGGVYAWQVKAHRDGEEVLSPTAPAPEAKFIVADERTTRALERAQRDHAGSHLLLGTLYAREGLLDAAEQEFAALRSLNPSSPIAGRLLESVRALRKP